MRSTVATVVIALVGIGVAGYIGMEADHARGALLGVYAAVAVIGFIFGRDSRAANQIVAGIFLIVGSVAAACLALYVAGAFEEVLRNPDIENAAWRSGRSGREQLASMKRLARSFAAFARVYAPACIALTVAGIVVLVRRRDRSEPPGPRRDEPGQCSWSRL